MNPVNETSTLPQSSVDATTSTTPTQLHLFGAVEALAGFMDAIGQTLTVYSQQLDANSEKSQKLLEQESEFNQDLPGSYVGFVFGGTTNDYAEIQKEGFMDQNETAQLGSQGQSLSALVNNMATILYGLSSLGKNVISAKQQMCRT